MPKIGKRKYIRQRIRQAKTPLNPYYLASCHNKTRFDKKKAKEVAGKLDIKVYKCLFCKYHHIGRRQA